MTIWLASAGNTFANACGSKTWTNVSRRDIASAAAAS